jgi:hypothetical protein
MICTAKLVGSLPLTSMASPHDLLVLAKSFRKNNVDVWDWPIIIPSIQLRTQLQGHRPRHLHYCFQQRALVPPLAGPSTKKLVPTNEDLFLDA